MQRHLPVVVSQENDAAAVTVAVVGPNDTRPFIATPSDYEAIADDRTIRVEVVHVARVGQHHRRRHLPFLAERDVLYPGRAPASMREADGPRR